MYPELILEAEPFEIAPGLGEAGTGLEFPGWEYGGEIAYEAPPAATCLAGRALAGAMAANRAVARRLGWACNVGGALRPTELVRQILGLAGGANESAVAQAVCRFQQTRMHQPHGDGRMSLDVMERMFRADPPQRFKALSVPVLFGGKPLGVIEKTMPYVTHNDLPNSGAGVEIELGFRVTDMANVRKAGFVDGNGDSNFRWLQGFELRRIGEPENTAIQPIRRLGRGWVVDPTTALLPAIDPHPYYWFEDSSSAGDPGAMVCNYRNRPANNGRFYDWIFYDRPNFYQSSARPGSRAYFNFETALVGIRPGRRNVILTTILWGYDILAAAGRDPEIRTNHLGKGPWGGSPELRRLLNEAINRGEFPGHCFAGPGFTGRAKCP